MAYFNNAATTFPKPEIVYEQMDKMYRLNLGSAGRGNDEKSVSSLKLVNETRDLLKKLFHATTKEIVFTPSATLALNMILQGIISQGVKNVYITPFEHNAVTRVLHSFKDQIVVKELKVSDFFTYDLERIKYQFDNDKPDLVVMSHASNVIGLVAPIEQICTLAKSYNAITVVDMAQTAGLLNVDLNKDIYDVAVFAGHKTLYGPTGIGGFILKPTLSINPVIFGGTGVESANQDMPNSLPARFEMGTMNISGIIGLNAAVRWLLETGVDNIRQRESENRNRLLELLSLYDFIKLYGINDRNEYVGVVSANIKGISGESAENLFAKLGIDVRTGLQCAPASHKYLGSFPSGTIRFSVSYFTTKQDFDDLVDALDYIEDNL